MPEAGEQVRQAADARWLHLDKDVFTGRSVLIHTRTCETHVLASGDWSIHDVDGVAGLVNADVE